jgi:hypothetical protein
MTASMLASSERLRDLYYLSKNTKKGLTFASFFYLAPGRTNPSLTPISDSSDCLRAGETLSFQFPNKLLSNFSNRRSNIEMRLKALLVLLAK